jgi:outer membrane receptor protein involved in Fe transport
LSAKALGPSIVLGVAMYAAEAPAQQASEPAMETVEAVAATPLGGELDVETMPSHVQIATAQDLAQQRATQLAEFMSRNFAGVFINDAQNNPLQPDVQYRGYVGSALLGLPQGIAVYQNGVRLNEPFGDTVNWALIPDAAIESIALLPGSNPLYGLNALGGAISIRTKDGFSNPGMSAEVFLGSFSRLGVELETGAPINDDLAYFITVSRLEEDGWRDYSPTDASQIFSSLRWESERSSLDASLTYADTELIGNGAAPLALLEQRREAIFTRPDRTRNALTLLSLSGSHAVSDRLTLTGNAYVRKSDIDTLNGDDSDFEECEDTPGFMCEQDDDEEMLLEDENGDLIPASEAVLGATINRTQTEQRSAGLGVQANWTGALRGVPNRFTLGLSYDTSDIGFDASTELGRLDATRAAASSNILIADAFTGLDAGIANTSVFFSNVSELTARLSLSVSGRFNRTDIELRDRLGAALNGDHTFERFNPAAGVAFKVSDTVSIYAGYAESNRAPSPVELTCADEEDPCRLPNAFLADPPLDDIVAKTYEAGIRGRWQAGTWHAGVFRATNEDDILFISAGALTNEGYFDNVGRTRRDGVELSISGRPENGSSWFANYSYLNATFHETFAVASANHPAAIDGEIFVDTGDRLPLIPQHLLKAGLRIAITPKAALGGEIIAAASSYYRGDEGNAAEKIDGYAVANLRGEYALNDTLQVYALLANAFDTAYETFGVSAMSSRTAGSCLPARPAPCGSGCVRASSTLPSA